eukprot:scaffold16181_cov47-Cyclotella_meneghiniana.AAC.2
MGSVGCEADAADALSSRGLAKETLLRFLGNLPNNSFVCWATGTLEGTGRLGSTRQSTAWAEMGWGPVLSGTAVAEG